MDKYIGFYIDRPIGNNIFSYEDRENKKIYVPKLIEGTLDDVSVGEEIVFNEIDEDIEIKAKGLKNMIIYKYQDKDVAWPLQAASEAFLYSSAIFCVPSDETPSIIRCSTAA